MPEQDKYIFKDNEHFELVLKGLNAGVYECHFQNHKGWWSSKFYDLLGYKRGDIPSDKHTLLHLLAHPEDRDKIAKVFDSCEHSPDAFIIEIRMKHRSGEYRWYKLSGQSKWDQAQALYIVGALTDIDARVKDKEQNLKYEYFLEKVGQMANVGGWEIIFDPFQAIMSKEMALIHDLDPDNIPGFEEVINFTKPEYKQVALEAIENARTKGVPFDIEIKIITAKGREIWVRVVGKPEINEQGKILSMRGIFQDIDAQKRALLKIQKNESLLEATGQMAKIGGWEVDFRTMQGTWSKQVSQIHEMPEGYQPSLEKAIQFVHPDYIPKIQEAMTLLMTEGKPFDEELKIITAKKHELWIRAMGLPVYDQQSGNVIIAQGVFQDIDKQKHEELALQASLKLIDSQNKRLVDFAHIISHNLRSHSTNLELTLSLMEGETNLDEITQSTENLRKISTSLKQTLSHLNEIVASQANNENLKVPVKFETVLKNVTAALKTEIDLSGAEIEVDFSECQEMNYIPAYLESIFLNLLSNALKYRRADTKPQVFVCTKLIDGKPALQISDNGQGIDLEKYGHKLFGMYKTFHHHPDAKGIGLYITRNQIESLGGKISVESMVNKGSTFTVNF